MYRNSGYARKWIMGCLVGIAGILISSGSTAAPDEDISDVLSRYGSRLGDPASRAEAVARIAVIQAAEREKVRAKAQQLGLQMRSVTPDGRIREIGFFRGDIPIYLTSRNADAAISTGVDAARTSYSVDGSNVIVGVWEIGGVRASHQEFGGRVNLVDATTPDSHATHVAGTIGASGVNSLARGMVPAAKIDAYSQSGDIAEMTARAATASGQLATNIFISNHSYGYTFGWSWDNVWTGTGTDQNAYDPDWGRYDSPCATRHDSLAYNAPYYLQFRAAGNETEDNPTIGETVTIGGSNVTYNPSIHPAGDGVYLNGYGTIGMEESCKNTVVVGAVYDAVTSGTRDLAKAALLGYSSTGPTDDGRIKPDLVANGTGLWSTDSGSDTAYASKWGTSMACPNATGSSALLVDHYAELFSGAAMRASTLKGLLIHTADDLGNAGPDYKFGWGLINAKAATDLLIAHQAAPEDQHLTEDQVSTTVSTKTYEASWDGVSPIRATLCWTDPVGPEQGHDSRTPVLVNDLDLKLTAPDNTEYFPYIMPYVGDWTTATIGSPATTGTNNVDNVEQVYIAAPPAQAGIWTVTVTATGTLTDGLQDYGLILSGLEQAGYTVTFDANGGSDPDPATKKVVPGEQYGTLATTSRGGYDFNGWFTASTGGTEVTTTTTVTTEADHTLYAQWTAITPTVSYDGNGSDSGSTPTDGNSPYAYGATVTVLGNTGSLARSGFLFAGWNTASNGSGAYYEPGETFAITADTTLFAQWETYTITYFGNGNESGSVPVDTSSPYQSNDTVTILGNTGSLMRTGFDFDGWNTKSDGSGTSYAPDQTFSITTYLRLYARWTVSTHTVTYDGTGNTSGSVPTDSNSPYLYNATVTVLDNTGSLSRNGQSFGGWNTAADGSGTFYEPGQTFTITGDVTLYAQYITISVTQSNTFKMTSGLRYIDVPVDIVNADSVLVAVIYSDGTLNDSTLRFGNGGGIGSGDVAPDWKAKDDRICLAYWLNPSTVSGLAIRTTNDGGAAYNNLVGFWELSGVDLAAVVNNAVRSDSISTSGMFNFIIGAAGANSDTEPTRAASSDLDSPLRLVFNSAGSGGGSFAAGDATLEDPGTYSVAFDGDAYGPIALAFQPIAAAPGTYTVTYDGNGNDGGAVPVDGTDYSSGAEVTVIGPGTLTRSGYDFLGWNTAPDGSGTTYVEGHTFTITTDTTLYAQWTLLPTSSAGTVLIVR